MDTPIDSLFFYTKLLTGLILLLNIALIWCIRLNIKALKIANLPAPAAGAPEKKLPKRSLIALIITVIFVNGMAIYSNQRLLRSANDVTSQFTVDLKDFVRHEPVTAK